MLKQEIKTLLKKWPLVNAAAFVADDLTWGIRLASGQIETNSGTTHSTLSSEDSIRRITEVFSDYKQYGTIEHFHGVAAELGPGDNAGVALLMRQDGCTRVDLIDRYFSRRNPEQQSKIYKALSQHYPIDFLRSQGSWDERAFAGINWKIGQPAEVYFQESAQNLGQSYDFIVSRAVLEHLYDPLSALRHMVECLKPGGRMLHKVDLRDHGMFAPKQHELTFLQIPSSLYRLMVRNSGRPNRILVHRYREVLEEMKKSKLIDYSLLVTRLVGVGDITPHQFFDDIETDKKIQSLAFVERYRQKFAREFYQVNSRDIAISGIFIVVNKK